MSDQDKVRIKRGKDEAISCVRTAILHTIACVLWIFLRPETTPATIDTLVLVTLILSNAESLREKHNHPTKADLFYTDQELS